MPLNSCKIRGVHPREKVGLRFVIVLHYALEARGTEASDMPANLDLLLR